MKYSIKISESLYEDLKSFLFEKAPKENGCFVLGHKVGDNILLNEICYPNENDLTIEEDLCSPSSTYIFDSALKAKDSGRAILFFHSHPNDWHPSNFSALDLKTNKELFTNLSEIVSNPIGSVVMSKKGITGVCHFQGSNFSIDKYSIVGQTLMVVHDLNEKKMSLDQSTLKMFNRQLGFLNQNEFLRIKKLHVAIVGCGGIGSPLAVMLAKMGIEKLSLFDDDKIKIHNLPRIYGANESDIGRYKVDVVKDHINSFSKCEVKTYKLRVDQNIEDFYTCDLIYGCLDNHKARATLNRFSIKLATPYIDSGCAIPLEKGNVINAATSITMVMPNKACLWCSGVINGIKLREESLTSEELSQQREEGYVKGVDSVPSVICLTTAVASSAANRLFNVLGIYSPDIPTQTVYDFNHDKKFDYYHKKKENCICSKSSKL